MKKNYLFILALLSSSIVFGQAVRYCIPVFDSIVTAVDVVYGNNISILTGEAAALDLKMDIYTAEGDDVTDRPVVLVAHTGSFLPVYFNGQATGRKTDFGVVEICNRLAKRGYVAIAYDYRLGWNPIAPDADVRKKTIIQAAYRGIQDTRTAVRFLRKSADTEGNPYGIDPTKIAVWGIGTGGYLSMGVATLNDPGEVNLDKFIGSDLEPYINPAIFGDIYGTNQTALCTPNHVDYSSDIQLCISMGGALGDASWIDGEAVEPPMIGVHCPTDIFGPYGAGDVIVPTTKQLVISTAEGVRSATGLANASGNNDAYNSISSSDDPMAVLNDNFDGKKFTTPAGDEIELTTDNFYPFFTGNPVEGAPWDWWSEAQVIAEVAYINTFLDPTAQLSAATIHGGGLATNPNMSAEKGNLYIDSTMMLVLPRMSVTFGLGCVSTDVVTLDAATVGLEVFPNPAQEVVNFNTNTDAPFETLFVYDINGRLIKAITDINSNVYQMDRNNLPSGVYFAKLTFEEGVTTQKIILE